MLVVTDGGEVLIGRYNVVTALVYRDPSGEEKRLTVNAKNYPFQQSKVMVYDQDYPLDTLPQEAMFYYLLRNHKIEYHGSDTKGITVQCNVGLNIGPVALGAMGRGVNTAVGEAVNITFRIESLTRKLDQPVLASAAFVDGIEGAQSLFEQAGTHSVKGQPEPVEVYALRSA